MGVPLWRWQNLPGTGCPSEWGVFLKVPSAPGSDTVILDFNAGSGGYFRTKLSSGLLLTFEFSFAGSGAQSVVANTGNPLVTGTWYWLEHYSILDAHFWNGRHGLRIYDQGGTLFDGNTSGAIDMGTNDTAPVTFALGIGAATSSAYAGFPNTAGFEMSKLRVVSQGPVGGPPTSDPSGGLADYNARQTVGSAAQLNDTSGNSYHATAASQGLTIRSDGPFAA